MKLSLSTLFAAGLSLVAATSFAAENKAANLDELLSKLANGQLAQTEQNKAREADFIARKNEQEQLLKNAFATRDQQIALSTQLENSFQENEIALGNKTDALNKRLGELKELFGVLQLSLIHI